MGFENKISEAIIAARKFVKKYPDKVINGSALDNKFVGDSFKQELKERYIEGTNLYRQQVLGEIVDCDVASQIVFRNQFSATRQGNSNEYYLGYDASGLGADKDVIMVIDKYGIVEYKELLEADTFTKAAIINDYYNKYQIKAACADATGGYSLGVLDTLKAKNIDIIGVNFAQKPYSDKYPNLAQQVTINTKGLQALVPKELIKKNIGHSPDHSDALALAVYAMKHNISDVYDNKHAGEIASKYLAYLNL